MSLVNFTSLPLSLCNMKNMFSIRKMSPKKSKRWVYQGLIVWFDPTYKLIPIKIDWALLTLCEFEDTFLTHLKTFLTLFCVLEISEETDEMRRQSNRYSCVMPGEQQITQYLIENPLINAILDDDEEKVNQLIRLGFWASNWLHSQVQIMKHKNNDSIDLFWEYS